MTLDRYRSRRPEPPPLDLSALSQDDLERLLAFRDRYWLEARGLNQQQASGVLFARWLVQQGRLS